MDQWYTLAELHERFGLLPSRVLELVRGGQLCGRCVGTKTRKAWLVSQDSLARWRERAP